MMWPFRRKRAVVFTEVSRDELRDWVRAERIAEADAGRMARVIEPPHPVAPIIRPETCAHYWLYSRTRCVWCGTFEQDGKAGYS